MSEGYPNGYGQSSILFPVKRRMPCQAKIAGGRVSRETLMSDRSFLQDDEPAAQRFEQRKGCGPDKRRRDGFRRIGGGCATKKKQQDMCLEERLEVRDQAGI